MISPESIPYEWTRKELVFNGPYKLGDKGLKAKVIQEWVSLHGPLQVRVDSDFGPATEKAVKRFQQAKGIPETGVVDEATFSALTGPMLKVLTPIAAGDKTLNELICAYAEQHLAEHPLEIGGQNLGPWVRLYMGGNEGTDWAWCAGFACFILRQAADTLKISMPIKREVGCDALAANAQEKGIFISEDDLVPAEMLPGSIFLNRNPDNSSDWTHTGLVTAFGEDAFDTIEGNTNDDGHREGYEVCARVRGYGQADFIKIA